MSVLLLCFTQILGAGTMADIAYISDFLNRDGVEGPRVTTGYIPCWLRGTGHSKSANFKGTANQHPSDFEAMGASGVTIATGCDMGQTDISTLRGYGVSDALISKLSTYIGLKKDAAIKMLSHFPLQITPDEAAELDHAIHGGYLRRYVRPAYDKASSVPFDDLPRQAQAVVFSVCFQKGCGGVRRDWPKTWRYLTTQNWEAASNELCNGFSQYKHRRRIEGTLLKELF